MRYVVIIFALKTALLFRELEDFDAYMEKWYG